MLIAFLGVTERDKICLATSLCCDVGLCLNVLRVTSLRIGNKLMVDGYAGPTFDRLLSGFAEDLGESSCKAEGR